MICDEQRTADESVPLAYGFEKVSGHLETAVGVSITGAVYWNGIGPGDIDPVYPTSYKNFSDPESLLEHVDDNLIHPQEQGMFHYHTATPAIAKTPVEKADPVSEFHGDTVTEIMKYFSTSAYARKNLPIGMAKDGHVIWGPYREDVGAGVFKQWEPCDVDVCNGAYMADGSYGYAATMFHPYLVGCWGPGSSPDEIGQQCSSKPRVCIPPPPVAQGSNWLYVSLISTVLLQYIANI